MSYGWNGTHDKRHHGVLLIKDKNDKYSMDNHTDTWLHVSSTVQVTCTVSAYIVPYWPVGSSLCSTSFDFKLRPTSLI
jgi:hypothetical protein